MLIHPCRHAKKFETAALPETFHHGNVRVGVIAYQSPNVDALRARGVAAVCWLIGARLIVLMTAEALFVTQQAPRNWGAQVAVDKIRRIQVLRIDAVIGCFQQARDEHNHIHARELGESD
jgi:hypothetical protein